MTNIQVMKDGKIEIFNSKKIIHFKILIVDIRVNEFEVELYTAKKIMSMEHKFLPFEININE